MCAAVGQRKSHQQRFDAENLSKLGDNRDAAAFADERGVAVKRFAQGALGRFAER